MTAPLHERLRHAADRLQGERVAIATLADAHGPAAQGTLLVLLAVPCMLPVPGSGTVLGLGLLALAVAMWRGHETALPRRVADFEMPRPTARRALHLMSRFYAAAGRVSRERWSAVAHARRGSWVAAVVALMAVLIVLPIPFGNVLPALSLMLFGLGLAFRDGLAVAAGGVMAGLATAFAGGLAAGAWWLGSSWLTA